jgi:hypothetical protein
VQPGDVEGLLDRHRHAVQRPQVAAAGERLVGRGGLRQRRLPPQLDHGVHLGVDGVDPRQQPLGQLARGELAAAQPLCHLGRGRDQDLVHASAPLGQRLANIARPGVPPDTV